jgi:HemY protein
VVLVLVLGFVTLHAALRALAALLELPRQAQRWRLQQRERSMHAALLDAFAQMLVSRFLRARKAALAAMDQEQALREEGETPPHGHRYARSRTWWRPRPHTHCKTARCATAALNWR